MVTVFVLFNDPVVLDEALDTLGRQTTLGREPQILSTRAHTPTQQPALVTPTGRISAGPRRNRRIVSEAAAKAELEALGLSPGESRFFAELMRQEALTLVIRLAFDPEEVADLLRQSGAVHAVVVKE